MVQRRSRHQGERSDPRSPTCPPTMVRPWQHKIVAKPHLFGVGWPDDDKGKTAARRRDCLS